METVVSRTVVEDLRALIAPVASSVDLDYIDGMIAAHAWSDASEFCRETAPEHGILLPKDFTA